MLIAPFVCIFSIAPLFKVVNEKFKGVNGLGMGYVYKCPACGHKEEYLIGVGFTAPTERLEAVERIKAGDYGPEPKAALGANPALEMAVDVEWALYQCPACFTVESRKRVKSMRHALKIRNHQFCDCGKEMHRFRHGMKMVCPSCRGPMSETDLKAEILWD